jgi:hypothetical protein
MLSREHHGPRAILNALERLVGGYGSECARVRQDLSIAEAQIRDYQERLGKPFHQEGYLSTTLRVMGYATSTLSGADRSGLATGALAGCSLFGVRVHTITAQCIADAFSCEFREPVLAGMMAHWSGGVPSNQVLFLDLPHLLQ